MRLKTLFFPVVLIISIWVVFVYIMPEVERVGMANDENVLKNEKLEELKSKSGFVSSASKQLSSTDSINVIRGYLPEKRIEERIISDVSYLANESNVALLNVSLAGSTEKNAVVAAEPVAAEVDPVTGLPAVVTPEAAVELTNAKISVSGNYQQVRMFLDGIQRLPIFNVIEAASIGTKGVEKAEGEEVAPSQDNLVADLDINFGYMGLSKISGAIASSFNLNVDKAFADVLKGYASSKNQVTISGFAGEKAGRSNPFLAK